MLQLGVGMARSPAQAEDDITPLASTCVTIGQNSPEGAISYGHGREPMVTDPQKLSPEGATYHAPVNSCNYPMMG